MPDESKNSNAGEAGASAKKPNVSGAAQQPELENPNAGTAHTPEISEDNAPSSDEPVATALPSSGKPDTEPTGPEQEPKAPERMKEEKPAAKSDAEDKKAAAEARKAAAAEKKAAGDQPAAKAKAKKEKPPAPEDKPFQEFINQEFMPNLKQTLANQGVADLKLTFEQANLPIRGFEQDSKCWQVRGQWQNGQRQFILAFIKEDISGPKFFTLADQGAKPATLESFMIDERRVTLDLMVFYTVQRLNGQKWLARN